MGRRTLRNNSASLDRLKTVDGSAQVAFLGRGASGQTSCLPTHFSSRTQAIRGVGTDAAC